MLLYHNLLMCTVCLYIVCIGCKWDANRIQSLILVRDLYKIYTDLYNWLMTVVPAIRNIIVCFDLCRRDYKRCVNCHSVVLQPVLCSASYKQGTHRKDRLHIYVTHFSVYNSEFFALISKALIWYAHICLFHIQVVYKYSVCLYNCK